MDKASRGFVSYSINYEDVLLRRLFADNKFGFFVDVGAADPVDDNDTYALSMLGWRGINVEPNPAFFRRLEAERPRDCNLQIAVSERCGTMDWYRVGDTGLSTCDEAEAARAAGKGYVVSRHTVETLTLAKILDDHGSETIDLLKVDVEGLELSVLTGNDWDRWRPRVILVEATLPESKERRPDRVTPFLEERGYRREHFDGLNDWYVEAAFNVPAGAFLPPNVFDGFVGRRQANAEVHAEAITVQLRNAAEFIDSLQREVAQLNEYATSLKAHSDTLQGKLRRSMAARADLDEDVRRSRISARDAHERCAAQAGDLESSLRAVTAGQEALDAARGEIERLSFELVIAERARQTLDAELAQQRQALAVDLKQHGAALADIETRICRAEARARTAEARMSDAEARARTAEARMGDAEARSRALESSSSWQITRPIRALITYVRQR